MHVMDAENSTASSLLSSPVEIKDVGTSHTSAGPANSHSFSSTDGIKSHGHMMVRLIFLQIHVCG